jgi:hypothetical protein
MNFRPVRRVFPVCRPVFFLKGAAGRVFMGVNQP